MSSTQNQRGNTRFPIKNALYSNSDQNCRSSRVVPHCPDLIWLLTPLHHLKRDLECEDKLDLEIHNPSICFCVCWEDWLNHIHFRQIKCYKITTLITVLKFICSNKQQYINCAEISTFALQNQLQIQFGQSSCYYETGKASKNREHAKLLCSHQCYSRCRRFFPKPRSFFH